jgi:hypothetical protein
VETFDQAAALLETSALPTSQTFGGNLIPIHMSDFTSVLFPQNGCSDPQSQVRFLSLLFHKIMFFS